MFLFKCTVILAVLFGVKSHHCLFNCDENGLVPTRLKPEPAEGYTYESLLTGCSDDTHCSGCTNGTGHKLYNSMAELVPVERCYSICFSNVTPSVESGSGRRGLFKTNVFAEDPCSSSLKEALVCFSACLFTLQTNNVVGEAVRPDRYNLSSNANCTDFCTAPGGICDRALSPGVPANCMEDCRTNLCPSSCQYIQNNFNLTTGSDSAFAFDGLGSGVELDLDFAEDVTLRKNGVMKIIATYAEPLPPPPPPLPFTFAPVPTLSPSKAYGLIWKVSELDGRNVLQTQYIPQHLPLFLLPQEVGPLYRAGSNLFAVKELQCETRRLEYALVNDQGVGTFTKVKDAQCFYGSWFPRPPKKFSADLRFQQSTGGLEAQFKADELSLDSQYVEEYRVQVLSGYKEITASCLEYDSVTILGDEAFQIENNSLLVRIETTKDVTQYFPNVRQDCNTGYNYFVVVYATTQNSSSCSKYPVGDVYIMIAKFPDYKYITFGDFEETIVRDHVSGKADVSIEINVTSHWTSLAILKELGGILRVKDWPVEETRRASIPAVPTQTKYVLNFPQLKPHKKEEKYNFNPEYFYRYTGHNFPSTESHNVYVPSLRPGPVQNMTVSTVAERGSTLSLNVSWMGPLRPEGKVLSYFIRVGSPRAMTLNDKTVTVEGEAQTDMSITQESHISIDLLDDEHFNVSVQAISEYGEEGEFEVVQIDNVFIGKPSTIRDSGPAWYLYVIIGVIFVVFVVFLVILGVSIYYYYKRNKVVILKNTGIFINGERDAEVGEEEDDVFQPVQIDSWEISPDYIIMDCMLGEGQFGEVYKGMIKGIVNNPYFQTSNVSFVAVKILRPEASASLKSDFLKEITTMKKITEGKCPNVVNMVGCCTLQEPLALVQEYVPHGDLLTYLRTVRKLNNVDYYPLTSPTEGGRAKGNEYVNHVDSPSTPMTPMTPASTCPLLINKEPSPPITGQIPSPYEKPYSSLGELKPVHLISFAHQIASGMKFLSDLGIVHRDLACRNVLVGENKTLKISDFGLARENDIYIKTTDGKLPLRWMAIESIVDRVFTTKSDVWSFGIVLWEITTLGGHPYPSVGNKALLAQLLRGYRMEKPENCSSELYDIMMNCWQAEASERPNFTELQGTLDVLLTNAQSENYIDLNVDEMLPYYSMSAVPEEGEEFDDLDLKSKNDGYPDTSGLNRSYLQGIQRPDSNSSDASISSTDVQKSTMPGDNTVRKMQDCTNTDCETQQNRETLHKEEKEEWPTLTSSGPEDSPEPQ